MKTPKPFFVISALIGLAALSRLLPHPPNFTAVGAIALFGAAFYKDKKWALIVPFLALWFSDLLLNKWLYAEYYSGWSAWFGSEWTYLGFLLIALLGMRTLRKVRVVNVLGSSLLASLIFFLVSNFGSWMALGMYPKNLSGLGMAYVAGIPFFWNTIAGDLFFTTLLFGSFVWYQNWQAKMSTTPA